MKKQLLLLVMILLPIVASAHEFAVKNADGVTIYYSYINDGMELKVTFRGADYDSYRNEYTGNVVIPEEVTYMDKTSKVTSIGDDAFRGCTSLTSVTIPNSVTNIGINAFRGCPGLASITIPNSVTSIGENAFYVCSGLTSIEVESGNTKYDSRENCNAIIETESNTLIVACVTTIIPNSVTSIGNYAFNGCSGLTSITIPNSVTSIGDHAFSGCSGLTSVTIGNSVTSIGGSAFYNCSGLTSVTIPNSVTSIGDYVFRYCSGLTSVTIPNSVTSIGNSAFEYCSGLTSITIPNSVTSIGNYAFSNCSGLTSVTIGNSLTNIGSCAFQNCSGLTSIYIPKSVTSIGTSAFNDCLQLKSLFFEDGEETLDTWIINKYQDGFFQNCPIEDLYLGREISVLNAEEGYSFHPFKGSQTLHNVEIGKYLKTIQNGYFEECSNLSTVLLSEGLENIGANAFYHCSNLESISFPSTLLLIGGSSFSGCNKLDSIIIPKNVKTIRNYAFSGDNLKTVIIEDSEELLEFHVDYSNSIAFSGPINKIYLGRDFSCYYSPFVSSTPFELTISKNVKSLKSGAFYNRKGVSMLIVEYSSEALKFYNSIPNIYLNIMPFSNTPIDSILLDRNIIPLAEDGSKTTKAPFSGVESSYRLTIGENINELSDYLFVNSKLDTLYIPKNVNKIGSETFFGNYNLRCLSIEDGENPLEIGGSSAFSGCSLDTLFLGRNLKYTFEGSPFPSTKERLSKLTLGSNITEINDEMFLGLKSITSIVLPKSLKTIGKKAFYGCSKLEEIVIPNKVAEIGSDAFNMCTSITKYTIEDGSQDLSFASSNYMGNSPLTEIYLGRNITYPNTDSPFSNHLTLSTLTIGESVSSIQGGTFAGNSKLKEVLSYANIVPETGQNVFSESYLESMSLKVPYSLYEDYKAREPWNQFGLIQNFEGKYVLTYIIDGKTYKSEIIESGSSITPEPAPTKEGYTFSGWSEIPETMPAHDVTVTGTFTINKYKLIYKVEESEYKSYDVEYGAAITPEPAPTKEGYTFSGWSEIPETMPAHDVTITGTFAINKYKLVYKVDGTEHKSYELEYGATITPEPAPTKEGYTFSGWSEIPETMPAHDVTVTGSFTKGAYKLTYMVDGEVYKSMSYDYGATITPEPAPTKEGYTFSGWSEIPETMPAHDVTITGSFVINKYKLTYKVDGAEYKSYELEFGAKITPEPAPTKEGYTFSGWSEIPETMPAHDVTATGTFTVNKYKLIYKVDDEVYKTFDVDFTATITPEAEPTKEGHTFSGWSEIPTTMPAHDVTVTGTFTVNQYTITYIIDNEVYTTQTVDYGSIIIPPTAPELEGYDFAWGDYPETMPAYDITIYGTYTTGIETIIEEKVNCQFFSLDGKPLNTPKKGVNIVRMSNGQIRKLVVK